MTGPIEPPSRKAFTRWVRLLVVLVIAASVVVGAALILLAATLGHCSAFGGRCPADQPALLDDDTFGLAATGALLVVAAPTYLSRPSWGRLGLAVASGGSAAVIVGLTVRSLTSG